VGVPPDGQAERYPPAGPDHLQSLEFVGTQASIESVVEMDLSHPVDPPAGLFVGQPAPVVEFIPVFRVILPVNEPSQ